MPALYGTYQELEPIGMDARCTCCERSLTGHALRWLEFDKRTSTYCDPGSGVPEDESQGCFPFGLTCAKRKVKEHEAAQLTTAKLDGEK